MAAATLCSNHAAVAGFSVRGMGVGRFWPGEDVAREAVDVKLVDAVNSTLRLVTSLLLEEHSASLALWKKVCVFADTFVEQDGIECTRRVVEALKFLSWNVS